VIRAVSVGVSDLPAGAQAGLAGAQAGLLMGRTAPARDGAETLGGPASAAASAPAGEPRMRAFRRGHTAGTAVLCVSLPVPAWPQLSRAAHAGRTGGAAAAVAAVAAVGRVPRAAGRALSDRPARRRSARDGHGALPSAQWRCRSRTGDGAPALRAGPGPPRPRGDQRQGWPRPTLPVTTRSSRHRSDVPERPAPRTSRRAFGTIRSAAPAEDVPGGARLPRRRCRL
jgi:hypothetical protein